MGKATVVSHIGEGRYLVDLDYGKDRIDERIQKIDEQIAQLTTDEAGATTKLAQAQAQLAARQAAVNAAIEAYRAALEANPDSATQVAPMVAAAEAAIEAGGQVAIAQLELSQIEFAKGEAEKDKTALQAVVVEEQKSVWCADYTTTASGTVATHEVPGEPNHIIIAPAGRGHGVGDGQLLARGAMTSAQAYFNAAILPGWQKFKPTHRIGTISNINEGNDTCTVTLEDIKSSAQNLGVNDRTTLSGVPVQYMTCNAEAFKNGERVLVEFAGQDWANPKVIGFADGPKRCPVSCTYGAQSGLYLEANGTTTSPGSSYTFRVRLGEDAGPVLVRSTDPSIAFQRWSDNRTDNPRTDTNVAGSIFVTAIQLNFPPVVWLDIVWPSESGTGSSFTTYSSGAPGDFSKTDTSKHSKWHGLTANEAGAGAPVAIYVAASAKTVLRFSFGGIDTGFTVEEEGTVAWDSGDVGSIPETYGSGSFSGTAFGMSGNNTPNWPINTLQVRVFDFKTGWRDSGPGLDHYADGFLDEYFGAAAWEMLPHPHSITVVHNATGISKTYNRGGYNETESSVIYVPAAE